MRLKEYGRNAHKRKEYVHQPDLLLVGVDVSKAKHRACLGTQTTMSCRKLAFPPTREGFERFEQPLKAHLGKNGRQRLLIAMDPSGLYWQALYEQLNSCGYEVCLGHCQAVRTNRKTMPDGTSKTDEKDAASLFALLRQGTCFLPVARAPERKAAYRLMPRHMALKKRVSHLRNQLRAALPRAVPELNPLVKDLTPPTAWRFLPANPTPASVLCNGRTRFFAQWQPRQRCGPWRPATFHRLYALAQASSGLQAPSPLDAFEITPLAGDLGDALTTAQLGLDQAIALLAHRADYQLLVPLPRIGQPTAAAILTAIGDIHAYQNGNQLVKLAGRELRLFASGSSIRKRPKLSPVGSAYRRDWLSHSALRLVAHEPQFKASYQRRKQQSPGKGAGHRALIAVCDKTIRLISRLLTDHAPYDPKKDQSIANSYAAQRKAA
jgi:transposase